MDVEKIIRVLGYIVYTALWSPVIVLALVVMPFVWAAICIRAGWSAKEGFIVYMQALRVGIQHDMNFIQTGKW